MVHAYDQQGPFIQNKSELSPKNWLYEKVNKSSVLKLGETNELYSNLFKQQTEIFWNVALDEQFANSQIGEFGNIEDDITTLVTEKTTKTCKCGQNEKSNKRICSKCKEPLTSFKPKRFCPDTEADTETKQSAVDRRKTIYQNIARGEDYKPADLVTAEPHNKNPSKYSDTKDIIRAEGLKAGIKKYGAGQRSWLSICCDGSPFKEGPFKSHDHIFFFFHNFGCFKK